MWSGQFVKAWSKTVGVPALSSGESELAAVVRTANGSGTAVRSNATAAIGMTHRFGVGKVRHGDLWVQHHARSGKFEFPNFQGWTIRAMHKPSILGRHHCCATRKRAIGSLSLMMTSRDECRGVAHRQDVDFVQNIAMHGPQWLRGL